MAARYQRITSRATLNAEVARFRGMARQLIVAGSIGMRIFDSMKHRQLRPSSSLALLWLAAAARRGQAPGLESSKGLLATTPEQVTRLHATHPPDALGRPLPTHVQFCRTSGRGQPTRRMQSCFHKPCPLVTHDALLTQLEKPAWNSPGNTRHSLACMPTLFFTLVHPTAAV